MSGSNGRRPSDLAVVLADAPELVRAGLAKLIDSEPGMHVALESGTGDEVVAGMRHLRSRKRVVALVGLGMTGDHDAFWLIRSIREIAPTWPVVAMGENAREADISRALLVGADGYIGKESGPAEFLDAVRSAAVGQVVLTGVAAGLLGKIADGLEPLAFDPPLLTQRELEVLRVATEGLTARQIGHRLGVRERTVTTHLAHIYRKLGTGSRVAAITAAARSGLVSVGPAE